PRVSLPVARGDRAGFGPVLPIVCDLFITTSETRVSGAQGPGWELNPRCVYRESASLGRMSPPSRDLEHRSAPAASPVRSPAPWIAPPASGGRGAGRYSAWQTPARAGWFEDPSLDRPIRRPRWDAGNEAGKFATMPASRRSAPTSLSGRIRGFCQH